MVQERSLKVIPNETTFFSKVSNTISKLLIPTKIGINGMMINIKRSSMVKAYEQLNQAESSNNVDKTTLARTKFDDTFTLYLEAIDKHIMDSIYKKVKNETASSFERDALANYYNVVHLKETEYLEYKYRKQKFLLDLDYNSLVINKKDKVLSKYTPIYVEKVDAIFKGILKNYSVKLADGLRATRINQLEIYRNIFNTVEDYVKNILPIKIELDNDEKYKKIISEYEEYEKFSVGKLDEKEFLEKNMILLGLSRVLFTHSLPLVAAEQCYNKLLIDTRNLLKTTKNEIKKEATYQMLLKLIEDYNVKLLSTKVYWDKPQERENYKKFWDSYSKAKSTEEKEILSLRRELYDTSTEYEKYAEVRKFYKDKLSDLGVMRKIGTNVKTRYGRFIKVK